MTLYNSDTGTGSSALKFQKNSSTNGNAIGEISFQAKTAEVGNPVKEYGRISGTIRNNAALNVDGSIAISGRVNDVLTEFARFNGADNENNFFLPLDMNGQSIKSSSGNLDISTTSSTGTGNIIITPKQNQSIIIPSAADPTLDFISIQPALTGFPDANRVLLVNTDNALPIKSSIDLLNIKSNPLIELKADFGGAINKSIQIHADGTTNFNKITAYDGQSNNPFQIDTSGYTNGSLEIKPNDTTGDLIFTSANLQSGSSGANSGQHLRIKLNGTYYKIRLEND